MAKSTGRRAAQGTNARRNVVMAAIVPVARSAPPELSREAVARLRMIDWHLRHGRNVSLTARHHGYSRPTVQRWLRRFDPRRLETLEDRSSRPVHRRRPTWTLDQLARVKEERGR